MIPTILSFNGVKKYIPTFIFKNLCTYTVRGNLTKKDSREEDVRVFVDQSLRGSIRTVCGEDVICEPGTCM